MITWMTEWLNFGTFLKFPCIVRIYAWFIMHCRNHHSDSHANHVITNHWGQATHIYVSKLTIIGSDNGLMPGRCQAIIWTNAGILLIGPLEIKLNEIVIEIHTFSFKKMHLNCHLENGGHFVLAQCVNTLSAMRLYLIGIWMATLYEVTGS